MECQVYDTAVGPGLFKSCLYFANSQNQGLENNGLIDTSYLVFKYAMVGHAF